MEAAIITSSKLERDGAQGKSSSFISLTKELLLRLVTKPVTGFSPLSFPHFEGKKEKTEHLSSASPQEEAALNGSRWQRDELCGFRRAFLLDFRIGDSMERYLYFKNKNRVERLRFSNDH